VQKRVQCVGSALQCVVVCVAVYTIFEKEKSGRNILEEVEDFWTLMRLTMELDDLPITTGVAVGVAVCVCSVCCSVLQRVAVFCIVL